MPRRWVREESLRLLAEAAATVDSQSYLATTADLKCALDSFLHQSLYAGIISPSLLKFLMKDFSSNKSGTFRLRVKLHKNPVVGRPIMNLSRTWMAPAAIFLTEALQPALKGLPHVISASGDVLELLVGKRVQNGFTLCTFDVRNLYPSIDRLHFLEIVSHRIHRFWAHKPEYSGFLIKLMDFVLNFQFVQSEGHTWQVTKGLPTGLQTSVVNPLMFGLLYGIYITRHPVTQTRLEGTEADPEKTYRSNTLLLKGVWLAWMSGGYIPSSVL